MVEMVLASDSLKIHRTPVVPPLEHHHDDMQPKDVGARVSDKGASYMVVILTLLIFGAYVMVGGTLPTTIPAPNTNLVDIIIPSPEPTKTGLQLYSLLGVTYTPVPTRTPTPTGICNNRQVFSRDRSSPCKKGELRVERVTGGWKETSPSNSSGLCLKEADIKNDLVRSPGSRKEVKVAGNTYHVRRNGGGDCTSISACINRIQPGDTLIVHAGNYDEYLDFGGDKSGASWQSPTTFKAAPGETVTIRGFTLGYSFSPARYMVFDGFLVDGRGQENSGAGCNVGDHIRLQNMEIKNVAGVAGTGGCSDYSEYINLKVHDNGFWADGRSWCKEPSHCHGIYVSGESILIDGGDWYGSPGWGIHLRTHPHNMVVRNTRIHDNKNGGIIETTGGNFYYNNILYNNGGWGGISVADGSKVYNNTIVGNTTGLVFGYRNVSGGNEIRNNIFYQNTTPYKDNGKNIINNNFTDQDPKFVNASAKDFHLQQASPAIDAGASLPEVPDDIEGNSRPARSAYDIGAYEYGSAPRCSQGTPKSVPAGRRG
jgi:hypothetical protein